MSRQQFFGALVLALLVLAIGFLASVKWSPERDQGALLRLRVAATTYPVYDLVRTVAGDSTDVALIVPPGALENAFEIRPNTIQQLQGVKTIFAIGLGLDTFAAQLQNAIPGSSVITLEKGIGLRENTDTDEGPIDPHYWLDFGNARIMVTTIAEQLSVLDPDNQDIYRKNAEQLQQALTEEEQELKAILEPYRNAPILVFHDAWFYFAENFGLTIAGAFEPFVAEEPTPRHLAELTKIIKEKKITAMFIEPQVSSAGIQGFAEENALAIATLDPLGGVPGRLTYPELMRYNVNEVIRSFGGTPLLQ